jgi:hypothetical protein
MTAAATCYWRSRLRKGVAAAVGLLCGAAFAQAPAVQPFEVVGNAVPAARGALKGDATRGRAIVDARRFNPATIMPSYHRIDGLTRVGPAWRGAPVLRAQQVEDVVAFLQTLRE